MNEAACTSKISALPVEDRDLITASARVCSFTHCSYLLASAAVIRLHASIVTIRVGFDDESHSLLHVEDNGHWSKKFVDALKIIFRNRVFGTLEKDLFRELELSCPILRHIVCLSRKVHIVWPVSGDSTKRYFSLKFREGSLTAVELLPGAADGSTTLNSVAIYDLFWNVPVRQKENICTETKWRLLSKCLEDLAVCHFQTQFKLLEISPSDLSHCKQVLTFGPFTCRMDAFISLKSLLTRTDYSPIRFSKADSAYIVTGYISVKKLSETHLHVPKFVVVNKTPVARISSVYSLIDNLLSKFYFGSQLCHSIVARTFSYMISLKIPPQECLIEWHEFAFTLQVKSAENFQRFLKSCISSFITSHREGNAERVAVRNAPSREHSLRSRSLLRRPAVDSMSTSYGQISEDTEPHSTNSDGSVLDCDAVSPSATDDRKVADENEEKQGEMDSPNAFTVDNCQQLLPAYFPVPVLPVQKLSDWSKIILKCHELNISKEDLLYIDVIGQFADSFIICTLQRPVFPQDTSCCSSVLVAVDQHAAHERIRLDRFLQRNPQCIPLPSGSAVDVISLRPADVFSFDSVDWKGLGFQFTRNADVAIVEAIPDILFEIFSEERSSGEKKCLSSFVIHAVVQILSNPSLYKNLFDVPAVAEAAKSASCHGALRVGISLSIDLCKGLIKALTKCQDPFRCAHGRPTIAPVANVP